MLKDNLTLKNIVYLVIALLCLLFVCNSLVLSNYGDILQFLNVPNSQPLIGKPRLVPGLDLEAYIYTPEFQILVNNGFERYNHTSLFNEDLRSLYSLPIKDWGLIFKPNMWAFFVIPPSFALSLFHLISIMMFIVGYYKLAKTLGANNFCSIILALTLFFSGFVQVWWMLFGATLAMFPWIILLLVADLKITLKAPLVYYLLTCWLISNFYPPLIIPLGFVGALLYFIIKPEFYRDRSVFFLIVPVIAAVSTSVIYLWDPIVAIKNSVYPGNRVASGGSDFPSVLWLNQIFPGLLQAGIKSLSSVEMAEAAAITSYIILIIVFFKDFSNWFSDTNKRIRASTSLLSIGLLLMWAWMMLPLPSWVGALFLWDHVQPRRMVVGSGILIFCLASLLINALPWRVTFYRCFAFSLAIFLPWIAYKFNSQATNEQKLIDLLPVFICLTFIFLKRIKSTWLASGLIFSCLLVNIFVFGRLNPIQSAKYFFSLPPTDALAAIQSIADNSPEGIVALDRFEGAVINGLGFRSAGHAFLNPQPQVYKQYFTTLSDEEFNSVFNRTSSVRLFYDVKPNSGGLGVNVPIDSFGANLSVRKAIGGQEAPVPSFQESGGDFSVVSTKDGKVIINGWAKWSGLNSNQSLYVYMKEKLSSASLRYSVNARGGEFIVSSFYLSFDLPEQWGDTNEGIPICLISIDPKMGNYLLEGKSKVDCKSLLKN